MASRFFLIGVTSVAIVLGIAYLATRGGGQGTSLAVYSGPMSPSSSTGFLFVESFDLSRHGTIPVRIREVLDRTGGVENALTFDQTGEDPALIRFQRPDRTQGTVFIRAANRLGTLESEVPLTVPQPAGIPAPDPVRAQGWPVAVDCGETRFVLLSESGVPEVGRDGRLLLLAADGTPVFHSEVRLASGKTASRAPLEPWGGTVLSFKPRSHRVRVRLSLEDGQGTTRCTAEFLVGARSRRLRMLESTVTAAGSGFRSDTTIETRGRNERLFAVAFTWDDDGPGTLVDARMAEVREGSAVLRLDLPSPGAYLVRFTTMPLDEGGRGINRIVMAGGTAVWDGSLDLLDLDGKVAPEALEEALPYVLATIAESATVRLVQLVNTSEAARARAGSEDSIRDIVLLGLLGTSLFSLIGWMAIVTIRGYLSSRRRLLEDGEEWSAEVDRIHPAGGLWSLALLVFILVSAIVVLLFVLQTM